MKAFRLIPAVILAFCVSFSLALASEGASKAAQSSAGVPKLIAQIHDSGFEHSHDTYNGMAAASDGKIYYILCSELIDQAGQMYCYDPATKKIRWLGDLSEACGEKGKKTIAQGKSHVNFIEADGKLYFSTHVGYYSKIDGKEQMPDPPPPGYEPYSGGHLLAYDMKTGKFEDLAAAPMREGILTTNMDAKRGRIFSLTWPTGRFFTYDLATKQFKDFGTQAEKGETGTGQSYRTICRSIAVDPEDGSAYFSISDGTIYRYRRDTETLETVAGDNLKKDYFGQYDITSPGHMAYNWRQTVWYPAEKKIYGVHGNSGYLFRFDPKAERIEVLDRLTSIPSQRSGMFDQFSYGYLGFALGPDNETLFYLTGGPVYIDGKRVAGKASTAMGESKGIEDLHLITYHIPTLKYADHGAIYFANGERPNYVNSIAVGKDGTVYTLSRLSESKDAKTDLISIPPVKVVK